MCIRDSHSCVAANIFEIICSNTHNALNADVVKEDKSYRPTKLIVLADDWENIFKLNFLFRNRIISLFRKIDYCNTDCKNKYNCNYDCKSVITCLICCAAAESLDNLNTKACNNKWLTDTCKDSRKYRNFFSLLRIWSCLLYTSRCV